MSLIYDDGQQAIAIEARRVLEARSDTQELLGLLEQQGEYSAVFCRTAREQGWCAITVAPELGGLGLGLIEAGIVSHQTGRTLAGAPFLTGSLGLVRALDSLGNADAKAQWLPRLASGEAIGAVAFAEGQDVIPRASAVDFSGGALNGVKPAVSGGIHADLALVLAQDGGTPVLVMAALDGVARFTLATFDNSRCAADLTFTNTPATELARGEPAVVAALDVLAAQAIVTAHEQTGGAEMLMERARDYALERRAFGQPIGAFQSVKHRIAELYGLVELARAAAIHAASQNGQPDFIKAAAAARIQATEAYDTAARDCVQIHGGIGVSWDTGLHLHMRRARTLALEQGNLLFWEDVLVDALESEAA